MWSADRTYTNGSVLPTCVGMVRECGRHAIQRGSPHVRGDGPIERKSCAVIEFSPRAWGWSERGIRITHDDDRFSPRAWGWSVVPFRWDSFTCVLPTCVGMVRIYRGMFIGSPSSPHVRGDGPNPIPRPTVRDRFSPRAWGWSAVSGLGEREALVLPTCVGMVRTSRGWSPFHASSPHVRGDGPRRSRHELSMHRSPHVRGDGPTPCGNFSLRSEFSPRAWGWSVLSLNEPPIRAVLPTCVGMVRADWPNEVERARSPHVRGDGPRVPTGFPAC